MLTIHQLIRHKKAQVAVLDLYISAMIFSIIVATVLLTWNSYNVKIDKEIDDNTILLRSYHISDLLTRYPGKPTSWELYPNMSDSVEIIGLASEDRVLDPIKVGKFLNFSDDYLKSKLKIEGYNFYFRLAYINGTDFNPAIEKGTKVNSTKIVSLKRYVIYNETETLLEFWLQK